MIRAYFLLFAIALCVIRAAAADVTLPDTIRIQPEQRVRIPVAGALPRLGQLEAVIRFTPGVSRIVAISGDQSYATTCPLFGMSETTVTRTAATVEASCGSGGAGNHDTLFAIILEGVHSSEYVGTIEVVSLKLDSTELAIQTKPCVIIKEGGVTGVHTTPTQISGNYPNPFSTVTRLSYSVERDQSVVINIRTIQGKLVRSFTDVQARAGENEFTMAFMESEVGSGRYIVELITKEATVYHGMAVMR
jgi:hypothetical protein